MEKNSPNTSTTETATAQKPLKRAPVLPGIKSPTILPLADDEWCSVHTVLPEKHFWEIINALKSAGAEGLLVLNIEKMVL